MPFVKEIFRHECVDMKAVTEIIRLPRGAVSMDGLIMSNIVVHAAAIFKVIHI